MCGGDTHCCLDWLLEHCPRIPANGGFSKRAGAGEGLQVKDDRLGWGTRFFFFFGQPALRLLILLLFFHLRLPEFDEGLAIPVSQVPQGAVVVWISHCWGGTPARPDDQGNTKAKAIYKGLKVIFCQFWRIL